MSTINSGMTHLLQGWPKDRSRKSCAYSLSALCGFWFSLLITCIASTAFANERMGVRNITCTGSGQGATEERINVLETPNALGVHHLGRALSPIPGGGHAMIASIVTPSGSQDILVLRTDPRGSPLWARGFGRDGHYLTPHTVVATREGGLLAVGHFQASGFLGRRSAHAVWVNKFDKDGNLEWATTLEMDGSPATGHVVEETEDGGFAIGGAVTLLGAADRNTSTDMLLVKLDRSGKLEWSRAYGGPGSDAVRAVTRTNDGGYLLVGDTGLLTPGRPPNFYLLAVKTDSKGELQWSHRYGRRGMTTVTGIAGAEGGDFVLAGFADNYRGGTREALVLRIAPDGAIRWARTYWLEGALGVMFNGIVRLPTGGYVVSGTIAQSGVRNFFVRIGEDGQEVWASTPDIPYSPAMRIDGNARDAGIFVAQGDRNQIAGLTSAFPSGKTTRDTELIVFMFDEQGSSSPCLKPIQLVANSREFEHDSPVIQGWSTQFQQQFLRRDQIRMWSYEFDLTD